jgi:hypothetical protein
MRYQRLLLTLASLGLQTPRVRAQGGAAAQVRTPAQPVAKTSPVRAEALPSKVDYVPQGRYDELRNFIVRAKATGGTLFNSPDGQTNYMMQLRTAPSDVEEHSRWDDLIIIRAGSGSVEVGPRTKGAGSCRRASSEEAPLSPHLASSCVPATSRAFRPAYRTRSCLTGQIRGSFCW